MNALAWLIIGIGVAAAWHAIYQCILLPSFRQEFRFKLFELRDRLRALKAEHQQQCSDDTFHMLDDSLSWRIDNLALLSFSLCHGMMKQFEADPEYRAMIEHRIAILNDCKLAEYVAIRNESNRLTVDALMANGGGWFIYLVPIAYVWAIWNKITTRAQRLNVMSPSELPAGACPA